MMSFVARKTMFCDRCNQLILRGMPYRKEVKEGIVPSKKRYHARCLEMKKGASSN